MSLGKLESNTLVEIMDVEEKDILEILEDYPTTAVYLALKKDCVGPLFEKFKQIVHRSKRMESIIEAVIRRTEENEAKISPVLLENMKEVTNKYPPGDHQSDEG